MRRLLLVLVVLIPASASAQRDRPFAEKGDLALVATVSGDILRLDPAFGGVGLRYRVADRTVVGASVGAQYDTVEDGSASESTGRRISVAVWNENHVGRRRGVVSPFVGAGVTFSAGDYRTERGGPFCDPVCDPNIPDVVGATQTTLRIGAGALLGAEVRLARGVTLGAAYTLGVTVDRSDADTRFDNGTTRQDRGRTFVRAGIGTTDLAVSVYF